MLIPRFLSGNKAMFAEACQKSGMDAKFAPKIEGWLKGAGFVNIQVEKCKMPIGSWPEHKKGEGYWGLEPF